MTKVNVRAFSLAEVLITLGIIGVVAAMTIPNLAAKIQDAQFKTAAKKAYAVTGQAFKSMQDDGKVLADYVLNPQTFKNEFMTYFKVIEDCGLEKCVPASYHSDIYKTLNGEKADASLLDEGQFTTLDGQFFMIQNSGYNKWLFITVDVNGYKSKPNVWGRDVFTFWVDNTGNLRPMGSPDSIWPAKKSCDRKKSLNNIGPIQGIGCMYNVINNVDY